MEQAVAYRPPALPVRECRLLDALAGRLAGFDLDIGGAPWHVEPQARSCAPGAAPVLAARAGDAVWRLALGPTQALLDALGLPDDIDREALPEAVLWGVAEARLGGLLARLEALAGQPARCARPTRRPGPGLLPGVHGQRPRGRECAAGCSCPWTNRPSPPWSRPWPPGPGPRPPERLPVELSIEAGSMTLTLAELRTLAPGDVLLPERWHPASGCVHLFAAPLRVRAPWPTATTALDHRQAKRVEHERNGQDGGKGGRSPQGRPGAIGIEWSSRSADAHDRGRDPGPGPGADPALPKALGPEVPVAILGNGRRLGTGRIVSVGETLGVQLTELDGHSS